MALLGAWFLIAWRSGTTNPDSRFCLWKIYRQTNGTYEVWWENKTAHREAAFATYDEAKAYRASECKALRDFMAGRPQGERVK